MDVFVNESRTTVELRRCAGILAICGKGIILFGIWELFEYFLLAAVEREDPAAAETIFRIGGLRIALFMPLLLGVLLLDLFFRILVGRSAAAVSKGKKVSPVIVGINGLMLILSGCIYALVFRTAGETMSWVTFLVTAIVEGTLFFNLLESILCMVKIGRLRKLAAKEAG